MASNTKKKKEEELLEQQVSLSSETKKKDDYSMANYQANKNRPTYAPSENLVTMQQQLADYQATKPGAYQSSYSDKINAVLDGILNRKDFTYDPSFDPVYKQYSKKYQEMGKKAMQDTMGQAASLTGGYGNSYATTAAQQAYNQYMQQANDILPQLEQAAYNRYQTEGDQMAQQLALLQGLEQGDYGRYRDDLNDYYNQLNIYQNQLNDLNTQEYNRFLNDLDAWIADRNFQYQQSQDALSQENWLKQFEEAQRLAAQDQANWEKQFNAQYGNKSSGGSSSGSSKSSGSKSTGSSSGGDTVTNVQNGSKIAVDGDVYSQSEFANLVSQGKIVKVKNSDGTYTYKKKNSYSGTPTGKF